MVKRNTCVFISGRGSNLKTLLKNSFNYSFPINIKMIVSSNINAKGLNYAKKNNIPFFILNNKCLISEKKILNELKVRKISLICLAGFMKILSKRFIKSFGKKIINIHPSLLPKYKGINTYNRILENKEIQTGCTIHYVNEKLDSGKIIHNKRFYLQSNESEKSLMIKTQKLELKAFSEAIIKIFSY